MWFSSWVLGSILLLSMIVPWNYITLFTSLHYNSIETLERIGAMFLESSVKHKFNEFLPTTPNWCNVITYLFVLHFAKHSVIVYVFYVNLHVNLDVRTTAYVISNPVKKIWFRTAGLAICTNVIVIFKLTWILCWLTHCTDTYMGTPLMVWNSESHEGIRKMDWC